MLQFVIAFIVFILMITLMAVGVLFKRKPIAGSCGGLNNLENGDSCHICGAKVNETCQEQIRKY